MIAHLGKILMPAELRPYGRKPVRLCHDRRGSVHQPGTRDDHMFRWHRQCHRLHPRVEQADASARSMPESLNPDTAGQFGAKKGGQQTLVFSLQAIPGRCDAATMGG
ncbi:hypothetical protein CKO51_31665 [Rhodopirellula sp. SM50]|nr:hypothetical protein CKO51_31665 [Rhodopirellula sp. SM50]